MLVAGGHNGSGVALATAELYDPSTGVWSPASTMGASRSWHTATLLGNGKVLVAGGVNGPGAALATAELYDPSTGVWSPTASMTWPRYIATATRLVSGKVLVAGGYDISADYLQSVEIYDPSSSPPVWTTATPMSSKRGNHTATLLPNGKVLLTGGWSAPMVGGASAEVYDPGTNFWAAVGSMSAVRIAHTATLLGNGKVLLAGGFNYGIPSSTYYSSAELYDPAATTWGSVTSMSYARIAPTATLLNDGRVLVTGGDSLGTRTELYNPATDTWAAGPLMGVGRQYHTATLLGNGKVLVVGIRTVRVPRERPAVRSRDRHMVVRRLVDKPRPQPHGAHRDAAPERQGAGVRRGQSLRRPRRVPVLPRRCSIRRTTPGRSPTTMRLPVPIHAATLLPNGKVLTRREVGAST